MTNDRSKEKWGNDALPTHNLRSREDLRAELRRESSRRLTMSLYSYQDVCSPDELREDLYHELSKRQVLGRIYIAREGVNGQLSAKEERLSEIREYFTQRFPQATVNFAIEGGDSFIKLVVKVKKQIVADGSNFPQTPGQLAGIHLDAERWHAFMDDPNSVVVDVRNDYEHEVGHFEGAHRMDVSTFREQFGAITTELKDHKDKKILLYCTGGIRCEKTSSMMLNSGFREVYQLKGGVLGYKKQIDDRGLESRFLGKNFVFDGRISERVTDHIVSRCYTCGKPSDNIVNCRWRGCNTLYVQCESCQQEYDGCCSHSCRKKYQLPEEAQRAIVKHFHQKAPKFKSRSKIPS